MSYTVANLANDTNVFRLALKKATENNEKLAWWDVINNGTKMTKGMLEVSQKYPTLGTPCKIITTAF
jgi:hypothetical protein